MMKTAAARQGTRFLARDVMHEGVVSVSPWMTLRQLATLFIDHQITGAPVVSSDGRLVGVVSETDLVRQEQENPTEISDLHDYYHGVKKTPSQEHLQNETLESVHVEDVMTPLVFAVEEAMPLQKVGEIMLREHIHRIIVTHKGKLCGIISSLDILHALLEIES